MKSLLRLLSPCGERNFTQQAFDVTSDWLLFEETERGPDEDLHLQFEAVAQLLPEEKRVASDVLEGLILKHAARQWGNPLIRTSNELAEAAK
jgi:hypothetical protein